MRMSLRLILSLVVGVTLLSILLAVFQVKAEKRGLRNELENRAANVGETLEGRVEPWLNPPLQKRLQAAVTNFGYHQHLEGIAVFNAAGENVAKTAGMDDSWRAALPEIQPAIASKQTYASFQTLNGKLTHVYVLPLRDEVKDLGALAVFHDASFIKRQTAHLWWNTFLAVLAQAAFIVLVTLLIIRWSIMGPLARTTKWIKEIRAGRGSGRSELHDERPFHAPGARGNASRQEPGSRPGRGRGGGAASRDRRIPLDFGTPARPRAGQAGRPAVLCCLQPRAVHPPYRGKNMEVTVPASGLVTAIEPILRTCQGTWLAHGSGDADRETVDERDCLRVPPDEPQYTLKRVWLTKEEEEGYYFGFSNEGLWPLCHIAHTRPIFRAKDWEYYQAVNQKFADALLEEMEGMEEPVVLVQDYHFALLPRLIKEKVPGARVAIFWHIPWPNPEAFGICPWQRELLEGLLGADLVGFHIQSHCNNFLETVDRVVESRVNWERFTVERAGHLTQVRPFPISVACSETPAPDRFPHRLALPGPRRLVEGARRGGDVSWESASSAWTTPRECWKDSGPGAILRKVPHLRRPIHIRPDRGSQPNPHQALSRTPGGSRGGSGPHQLAIPDQPVEAHSLFEAASIVIRKSRGITRRRTCAWSHRFTMA